MKEGRHATAGSASFRRIEPFSADAAHESRTPLTAVRGHLEVALRSERSNALKFSPKAGHIEVRLSQSDTSVVLVVTDEGPGIPAAELARIFDRFHQVAPGRHCGSGLDLSLAQWIARLHQGTISVASTPGQGSAFTVELSRQRCLAQS